MKVDIQNELRDFPYITNLYKYIESYNIMGHQIGRKIGDMLEILTMGSIYRNHNLLSRLDTEGKLEGYTTAGHKVEFGFYNDLTNKRQLFGAVECKCVGVEVTKSGSANRHIRTLGINESISIDFSARWMQRSESVSFTVLSISPNQAKLSFENTEINVAIGDNIKIAVDEHSSLHAVLPNESMYEKVQNIVRACKIVKIESIANGKIKMSLWNCLTGPQTIEKAKQASLVAMDIRRKVDGHWGKEDIAEESKSIISILVLCEFSHWETKSRNVIKTCIDHNLIIPDEIMIKSFQEFEREYGIEKMQPKISKNSFKNDESVRRTVNRIIDHYEEFLFYDVEKNSFVKMDYMNNKLLVTEIV